MVKQIVNGYVEKIQYLPNDFEISVSKSWCSYVIGRLRFLEYFELSDYLDSLIDKNIDIYNDPRYIKMSIYLIKEILSICGDLNFECVIPYNYDNIIDTMLCDQLSEIKSTIEFLIEKNKIDDVLLVINNIDNKETKRLALLCAKIYYNKCTEQILDEIKNSKKRTLKKIENNFE